MLTPRPQSTLSTGKKIANYIYYYQDIIGKGNFAKVYRATHLITKEIVAIKAISLDELKSKRLQALVFQEIKILQLMGHPYVLKFHEALLSDRNCYIVTELCNGGNLQQRVKRGPLSNAEISSVILQLLDGLKYLRAMEVVHRDFKTANIFLNNGMVKIADFGLAKFYKERFHDLDIGSPHYMSPQGLLLNVYGEKTDVWALGIVIYQMIHGKTPFGFCREDAELKYWIVRPLVENAFKKDIHPCFKQLIMMLLEIDENRRPNVNEIMKMTIVESLQDIIKISKINEVNAKRKFSFSERPVTTPLFQKKNEVNCLNANLPMKTQPSKSFYQVSNPNIYHLKPNQSFTAKSTQPFMPKMTIPLLQLQQKPTNVRQSTRFYLNTSTTIQPSSKPQKNSLWEGQASTKTNQTRQSQESQKYQRVQTQRSFYK